MPDVPSFSGANGIPAPIGKNLRLDLLLGLWRLA
jgi:hypothetical protein